MPPKAKITYGKSEIEVEVGETKKFPDGEYTEITYSNGKKDLYPTEHIEDDNEE